MSPGSKSNGIVSDGLKEKLMDEILHLSDVDIAPPIHPLQYDVSDLLFLKLAQHFADTFSFKFVVGVS